MIEESAIVLTTSYKQLIEKFNHWGGEVVSIDDNYKRKHQRLKFGQKPKTTPKPGVHAKMRICWELHNKYTQ